MFDSFVSWGAPLVGMPEDMFRYLIAFFAEIPITLLCRYVPDNQKLKHFLFGFLGMVIAYFVYSTISFSVFVSMIPVYFIMKYMPNRKGAYLSFAISVGYLIFLHIKRMVDNYLGYTLDFSGLQMILTIKFTTFAFSVSNAHDEEYKCSPYTENHKIKKYPTLLEFFGYTFFFPAYFSGKIRYRTRLRHGQCSYAFGQCGNRRMYSYQRKKLHTLEERAVLQPETWSMAPASGGLP